MSTEAKFKHRPVAIAAAVASGLMLVFGLGYRAVAARLEAPVNTAPVSQESLDRLPLEIGGWTGQDTPVDADIIKATDTDAHVSRRYVSNTGSGSVSLWIASGVRARDLMPHRPEVCYVGSGYTLVKQESPDLPLADGSVLPCNAMQFSRGVLNNNRVLVLYYYIVDGQYCRDVSEWRYRLIWTRIGYIAQVQVVAGIAETVPADAAMQSASAFAVESAPLIASLFQSAEPVSGSD
jgi:EpsI family protein